MRTGTGGSGKCTGLVVRGGGWCRKPPHHLWRGRIGGRGGSEWPLEGEWGQCSTSGRWLERVAMGQS